MYPKCMNMKSSEIYKIAKHAFEIYVFCNAVHIPNKSPGVDN
jgi:hypothetical protein